MNNYYYMNRFFNVKGISLVFSIAFIAYLPLHGQEHSIITLKECLEIALKNNSELKRSELALKRGQIDFNQSRLNLLPSVSASISHGVSQGRSVDPTTNQFTENTFNSGSQGLSADMTLFNGFRMLHDIRMKAVAREAGRLDLENHINEFKLDVIEAYVQVLTATDMLTQALNQLEVTREQLRRAEIMYGEGYFPPGDYYDIQGQIKSEENQLENTKRAVYTARLRLSRMMQVEEYRLGNLAPLEIRPDGQLVQIVDLYDAASENLPSIRALDQRIAVSRQQIGIARSGFFPSLSIGAGLSSRFSDSYATSYMTQFNQNLGKYVSLSLRIPVFNRLQTVNQVRQAKLGHQEAQLQKEIRLHQLKEEIAQAVFDLQTTRLVITNLSEQVDHYAESFRIAQAHFETGASNSFLFLAAKNKVDAARQQLLIKQYEYVLQQYIHDYYQGELGF